MSRKLDLIREKIEAIRDGLLRFRDGNTRRTLEVKTTSTNGLRLNCVVKEEGHPLSLLNREVNLVQKKGDDYLYISGRVDKEQRSTAKTITLKINKAFWFTRQKKGSAVWLEEKFIYDDRGEGREKAS